jgi:hypothetical protein
LDGNFEYESIANVEEKRFVEMLLGDPYWRHTLFQIAGTPREGNDFCCVDLKGVPPSGGRGDIDVLRFPVGKPELATAIQVKRIKVSAKSLLTGQPNKLSDSEHGVRQANLLSDLGFHQVYLYLCVQVDRRERNAGSFGFEGSTMEIKSLIRTHKYTIAANLRSNVGLCVWEFTQSMDDAPLGAGAFGGDLVRLAKQRTQPDELTAWISNATVKLAPTSSNPVGNGR